MQGSITSQEGRACQSSAIICFRQAAGLQSDCPSAFPWCHIALYLSTVPKFPRHLIIPILARCVSDRLSFNFSISISLGKVKIFFKPFWEKSGCVYKPQHVFIVQSQSRVWLCDPMDCTMPGSSVFHCLLEFARIRVHWVSNAIQQFCPLSSPSPPAFNLS